MQINGDAMNDSRTLKKVTTAEVAVAAGLSERTIQRYEKKGGKVNIHVAKAIAKRIGVPVEEITK